MFFKRVIKQTNSLSLLFVLYLQILLPTVLGDNKAPRTIVNNEALNSSSANNKRTLNNLTTAQEKHSILAPSSIPALDTATNLREEAAENGESQPEVTASNSTTVEDLVNQFMERNEEAVRRVGHSGDSFFQDNNLKVSTPSPYMQSYTEQPSSAEESYYTSSQLNNNNNNNNNDEAEDEDEYSGRHIRYDVVETEPAGVRQRLHSRHAVSDNIIDKFVNHKSEDVLVVNSTLGRQNKSNQQEIGNQNNREIGGTGTDKNGFRFDDENRPTNSNNNSASLVEKEQQVASQRTVQARSMNNISGVNKPTPQHTRPPYATYDQFHHRSDANQGAATPAMSSAATQGENIIRNSTNNGNKNANQDVANIVKNMGRLSSELAASEAARGEHQRGKHQQLERDSASQVEEINKQQLQKLASSGQLIELSPIPLSDSLAPSSGEQHRHESIENSRFYFSKDNPLFGLLSAHQQSRNNQKGPADRFAGSSSYQEQDQDSTTNGFSLSNNNEIHLNGNVAKVGQNEAKVGPLDSRSSHHFNQNLLMNERHQQQIDQVHHSQDKLGNSYAASLINVTAPMILPLSATEAMESTLNDQAAKSLLHQPSGFVRSPTAEASILSATKHQLPTHTSVNQRQSQYFVPAIPSVVADSSIQSIYSQPANQFSPKPPQPVVAAQSDTAQLEAAALNSSYLLEERMRLNRNGYTFTGRKPSNGYSASSQQALQNHTHQASGFRSPLSHSTPAQSGTSFGTSSTPIWPPTRLPTLSNYLSGSLNLQMPASAAGPQTTVSNMASSSYPSTPSSSLPDAGRINAALGSSSTTFGTTESVLNNSSSKFSSSSQFPSTATTSSMIMSSTNSNNSSSIPGTVSSQSQAGDTATMPTPTGAAGLIRHNLTRVEHISAECSNDLIRTVIIFNGTFKGIIYSSGYVRDPNCMYINGTGKTRYDFSIRLNQCGTLGRQELHPPVGPNEVRRRDQVMWNTLSIQYNPIIEQEWDEHFRVSCEYGSDFWKTISFSPFNVETNTGSPVVFTVDPPQCQMEILRGHGMVGPRQEAVSGPVTVGDPLTLLIHMKSEKAGYDILVKNCVAHNGGHQRMQLIDSNGCVNNERFISPFRGTYNDNDQKHVTLYSYLKAFRFTGSPVLYLECEIHMCQNACPPQMCYWRRLSKRSAANETLAQHHVSHFNLLDQEALEYQDADSWNPEEFNTGQSAVLESSPQVALVNLSTKGASRQLRKLNLDAQDVTETNKHNSESSRSDTSTTLRPASGQISDKVSLFQALEVRQEREPDAAPFSSSYSSFTGRDAIFSADNNPGRRSSLSSDPSQDLCYGRAEVLAFLFTAVSVILVAVSITVGCCWRVANLRRDQILNRQDKATMGASSANLISRMSSLNSLLCKNVAGGTSLDSSSLSSLSPIQHQTNHHLHSHHLNHQNRYIIDPNLSMQQHQNHSRLSPKLQHHSARQKDRF